MLQPVSKRIGDERRFQLLVEAVTDYAICLLDVSGRVATWNSGAERIKGYASRDIVGQHYSVFFTEEDRAAGKPTEALETALRVGRFESEGWRVRKDGSRFWAVAVLDTVRDEEGHLIGFAKVTRDMTERRAAQEALRESERRFRLLVDSVAEYAIYMLDTEGRVTNWNSGAQRIKGYAAGEIIGEHFSRFYTPEDREAGLPQRALQQAAAVGKFEAEGWRVRKDGSRFWASVMVHPIRDENGHLLGYAKVTRDITGRREAQRALDDAREQLFHAQKMEAIGQLTGGVAHDFNNLLTVIVGGADLAEPHIGDNEKLRRLIGNMRRAARRGESLTKQLLAFSRRQPLRPETVDLSRQLRVMSDLLASSLRGGIGIVTDVAEDLACVAVDPSQLELAFLNVGLNARDAMGEGGTLCISAGNAILAGEPGGLEGKYVVVALRDEGSGMPDDIKARAFEPFFTTKQAGGSGLGLSQAYGFAKQSGGTLTLDSELGKGTTVTFYLPASQLDPLRPATPPAPAPARRNASANILVVEDEPSVAELAFGLLDAGGYSVTVAENAEAALAIMGAGAEIDLVFSDIMMPGAMNGAELARLLRKEFPGVFILLATGYAEAAASKLAQEFPLITKPYGRDLLLDKVARILGEGE
jgi:PAS domain S-box-containing protein